jgi:N-acetylmuramoyl-L-alanine amidase
LSRLLRWLAAGLVCVPLAAVSAAGESTPEPLPSVQVTSAPGAARDTIPTLPLASAPGPIATAAADAERLETTDLGELVTAHMASAAAVSAEQMCLAKVVYHEAANQPLKGQLAVAQVILNRMKSVAFPKSACAVVNQPGQFFQTAGYRVPADPRRWRTAMAIALVAEHRHLADVAPGALFFHAAYVSPPWRKQHIRIAQIGDHIFYR